MNLTYAEIIEIRAEGERRLGKIRMGGALKIVSLDLLTDPAPGDTVLLCEGVALARVESPIPTTEVEYVPGHTR